MEETDLRTTQKGDSFTQDAHRRLAFAEPTLKSLTESYKQRVRPLVAQLFKTLKLDLVFTQGEGDRLWAMDRGSPVLDFLGSYGVNIVGHNHPQLVAMAKQFFENQVPMFAQASVRRNAALFADKVNQIIRAENHIEDSYVVTMTNSGAESVEAALKHALMVWNQNREKWEIELKRTERRRPDSLPPGFRERFNQMQPLFFSIKDSFHGKTSGAVSVTWNQDFRSMYKKGPFNIEFIDREVDPVSLEQQILQHSCGPYSAVAGIVIEPIQCEGGIVSLSEELFSALSGLSEKYQIPLIVDEIQTGLYRTGRFLASSAYLKAPDYVLLGKGLGGGLSKCGAVLVKKEIYFDHFGVVHSSTFAEDEFSALMATETLELLKKSKSLIEANADRFEVRMREGLANIAAEFPGIIKEVRGEGFLFGVEFDVEENKALSPLIDGIYQCGMISYLFASYLLHNFDVRVGVTLSKPNVLRIQPSFFVEESSVSQLLRGLRSLVQLISERKMLKMTRHFWNKDLSDEVVELPSVPYTKDFIESEPADEELYKVGFLTHIVDQSHLKALDPLFQHISKEDRIKFLSKFAPVASPLRYHRQIIRDLQGRKIQLSLYGVFLPSHYFIKHHKARSTAAYDVVRDMCRFAVEDGCQTIGLGQFTSIVTDNAQLLEGEIPGAQLTTGNNLTIGSAVLSIRRVLSGLGKDLKSSRIAVVGAPGNIGSALSTYLSTKVDELYLYYYQDLKKSPRFQKVLDDIQQVSPSCQVMATDKLQDLAACDVVVVCTNATDFELPSQALKRNAVVLDLSVPSNISSQVVESRPDVTFYEGGFMKFPLEQKLETHWVPAAKETIFACMAETILLGLHRSPSEMYSVGPVDPLKIDAMLALAENSGIELGQFKGRR